jgi:Uma2 family endonuclease
MVASTTVLATPPLESGDRLTRAEFERRYARMPNVKAELIEGVVYMASAVRARQHGQPHAQIIGWLSVYAASTPGVMPADNTTVRLDADNEVQPDALLRLEEGGTSRLGEDDYVEGAPELIVEIAASSAAYDLHDKLKVYRRNGVQEYLVWQVFEGKLEWFELHEGAYHPLEADGAGLLQSRQFPGLWLRAEALLEGRMAEVLATVQEGLRSLETQPPSNS